MAYFTLEEAAKRYDSFRPKVHGIIAKWLNDAGIQSQFRSCLDVACGTGDSTLPLQEFSDNVIGIDLSESMLDIARDKGLSVTQTGYEEAYKLGTFDLITTCMAFHWFDSKEALESYKKASSKNALWLIYNFSFGGSEYSEEFNEWFVSSYLKKFPSPQRNKQVAKFESVEGVECLASKKGTLPIVFSNKSELIKYLTTQSNVEEAVKSGLSYSEVESQLGKMLDSFDLEPEFRYKYSYELYRFTGN